MDIPSRSTSRKRSLIPQAIPTDVDPQTDEQPELAADSVWPGTASILGAGNGVTSDWSKAWGSLPFCIDDENLSAACAAYSLTRMREDGGGLKEDRANTCEPGASTADGGYAGAAGNAGAGASVDGDRGAGGDDGGLGGSGSAMDAFDKARVLRMAADGTNMKKVTSGGAHGGRDVAGNRRLPSITEPPQVPGPGATSALSVPPASPHMAEANHVPVQEPIQAHAHAQGRTDMERLQAHLEGGKAHVQEQQHPTPLQPNFHPLSRLHLQQMPVMQQLAMPTGLRPTLVALSLEAGRAEMFHEQHQNHVVQQQSAQPASRIQRLDSLYLQAQSGIGSEGAIQGGGGGPGDGRAVVNQTDDDVADDGIMNREPHQGEEDGGHQEAAYDAVERPSHGCARRADPEESQRKKRRKDQNAKSHRERRARLKRDEPERYEGIKKKNNKRKRDARRRNKEQAFAAGVGASAMHGPTDQDGPGTSAAAPLRENVVSLFRDRDLGNLVKDALPDKPQRKYEDILWKLEAQGIDCVTDMQALAEDLDTPEKLEAWLEETPKLPSLTSSRLARFFFESAVQQMPQGD